MAVSWEFPGIPIQGGSLQLQGVIFVTSHGKSLVFLVRRTAQCKVLAHWHSQFLTCTCSWPTASLSWMKGVAKSTVSVFVSVRCGRCCSVDLSSEERQQPPSPRALDSGNSQGIHWNSRESYHGIPGNLGNSQGHFRKVGIPGP